MAQISGISRIGYDLALCAMIWMGFALPLRLLDRFPLREDEAIYSFWALHFWYDDPFFLTVWPDKPPLFLWLLAGAFQLGGVSQATGRLLNIILTLLAALVIGATARRLWGQRSGFIATGMYLLNPFVLSFAPTIYTDPLLVLSGQLALFSAITGRSLGAGFWLAVAIMSKQQGVLYAPLIVALLWDHQRLNTSPSLPHSKWWLRFGVGALIVLTPIIYWDSLRWAVAPSPWDLGVRNYGALHMVAPVQWLLRSGEWAKLLWYFTASWPVWLLLALLLVGALWRRGMECHAPTPQGRVLLWLLLWASGFLALHSATTTQIWDRYLLPLAPLFCLLTAWAFTQVDNAFLRQRLPRWSVAAGVVCLLVLAPPALSASTGGLPIGADHGAYSGLTEAVTWLKSQSPKEAILYHQQLGWHYQFYLYDQLAAGMYELRWFPSTTYLAGNAAKSPYRPRLLVQPDWAPQPDLPLHLAVRRLRLVPQVRFEKMTVYAMQTEALAPCAWCLCRTPAPWSTVFTPTLEMEFTQP